MGHMEYEKLCRLVEEWNDQRLDLFHLSQPTKDLEVEGVMRFYFCDDEGRICTKCIRVSSTATTQAVIDALVDKFLPDLKMLTNPDYTLWEVHEGGEERRLDGDEKPLLVQLNWHKDDKEGRFLLKKHGTNFLPIQALRDHDRSTNIKRNNKRFSKREKNEEKVKEKHKDIIKVHEGIEQENINAMGLYKQVPPTTFTRTISNPEVVMKKRREKKIESKLKEMGHGGSLKVYGEEILPSKPYVTLLVSAEDRAKDILNAALMKYNISDREWNSYILVKVEMIQDDIASMNRSLTDLVIAGISRREKVVPDEDCPLIQLANTPSDIQVFFTIRRRNVQETSKGNVSAQYCNSVDTCVGAYLISLRDQSRIDVSQGVTEVGNDGNMHLFARHHIKLPFLCSRHCVITFTEGVFTITPSSPDSLILINERKIDRTATFIDGDILQLGRDHVFRLSYPRSFTNGNSTGYQLITQGEGEHPRWHEASHMIPLSVAINEKSMWNLLIEALSRSAETSPFPLTSSFVIFIGLHSLVNNSIIGEEVITSLSTHLSHISNDSSQSRTRILYWLSNTSHLHYLLSTDKCFTLSLTRLSSLVQYLYRSLVTQCTNELDKLVPSFFHSPPSNAKGCIVSLLDSILNSCRGSLLNADITIQLASQLFSSLNASLFNQIVDMRCTSSVGEIISNGLSQIDEWSRGMGVELAAECLLDTCRQAANLLMAPKNDMTWMGSTTYKLNSLQIRHLLSSFVVTGDENCVESDVLYRMIGLAERQADEISTQEGIPLSLLETNGLSGMEMILPQDGYFISQSLPQLESLKTFLNGLSIKGVCWNIRWNEESIGWVTDKLERSSSPSSFRTLSNTTNNVYNEMNIPLVKVHINRGTGGIGLSIVAAQGVGDIQCGIYIKKVLEGSVAELDGRMKAGDELVQVNDTLLRGLSQEEAARTLSSCGPIVRFLVRKGAASSNGLLPYLMSPPPQSTVKEGRLSPSPSSFYTPLINKEQGQKSCDVTQSCISAFSIPTTNIRSISSNDLCQANDPNTSFSGRSIASSNASTFSGLPSHYKRPTVIQPARSCASPSNMRSGAVSPSILSHSSYRIPSPHANRKGAISPTPLSHSSGSMQHVDLINSPPLARSSPIHQTPQPPLSQPINSFTRSIHSSSQRNPYLPPRVPLIDSHSVPCIQPIRSVAHSTAFDKRELSQRNAYNKRTQNSLIDDLEGSLFRMNLGAEVDYGEDMSNNMASNTRPMVTPTRRETLIDDVAEYDDSPSIVGAQEVYRDPRTKRMLGSSYTAHSSLDGSKLGFGDKMRFFAKGIGESTPPTRVTTSSAQRIIQDEH